MEILKLKTSRKSFIWNYIIGLSLLALVYIFYSIGTLQLTLFYFFTMLILLFFLESEAVILYTTYLIEPENVTEVKGVLSKKKRTIPYSSIAHSAMRKSVFGRILGFGDVMITPTSGSSDMMQLSGIGRPERIFKIIREKSVEEKKAQKR